MISHLGRQGLGRIAEYNGYRIPTVLFLEEDRVEGAPVERVYTDGVEILGKRIKFPDIDEISSSQLKNTYLDYGDIIILPGLFTLLRKPENLLQRIISARLDSGLKKVIFAPFIAEKMMIPVLHYLGIDVLDAGRVRMDGGDPGELWEMERITLDYMEKGELRVLVESIPHPLSKTLLRLSDSIYYTLYEKFFPVTGKSLNSSHFESLFRPDVRRWRERIIQRYRKPGNEEYLLLIPCSATKPYSRSPSHRYFHSLIEKSGKHVHEVIVTSPLGLVPRELEYTYPAAHYDIPVTGRWYGEEREFTIQMLEDYIKLNRYRGIIAFLPDDLLFLKDFLDGVDAISIFGNLRSEENQRALLEALSSIGYVRESLAERINSISRFQFGVEFPLDGKRITRRYDEIMIYESDEMYIHFHPMNGKILLGKGGAEYIASRNIYTVEIDDFTPKGSIFVSGIRSSTEDIREGDEVAVVRNGEVIGTGTATMCHEDMESQEHGEAVRIRRIFSSS
ncbi:MAG: DUF5591 domain-containing protein [Thermoplasmata archaeon]